MMLTPVEYAELTRIYPILAELSPKLRESIQQDGSILLAPEGQVLLADENPLHTLLHPLAGTARVVKPVRMDRELVLYRLHAGDICFLSAISLLSGSRHPGHLISETSLTGVCLSRDVFRHLVEESPAFRHFVFAFLADHMAIMMDLIDEILTEHLDQRLALVLLRKGDTVQATHQMLADEVGTVREVVSRILKRFEAHGVLTLGRRRIRIRDPQALRRIAFPDGDSGH
jgi:CRP/FNR family transcriptional regulator